MNADNPTKIVDAQRMQEDLERYIMWDIKRFERATGLTVAGIDLVHDMLSYRRISLDVPLKYGL